MSGSGPQTFSRQPTRELSTRDCIDPWFFAMLTSGREVKACCWHPPVGVLAVGGNLDEILNGAAVRALRQQLLEGNLNKHCQSCPARPLTTPEALRKRIERELAPTPRAG